MEQTCLVICVADQLDVNLPSPSPRSPPTLVTSDVASISQDSFALCSLSSVLLSRASDAAANGRSYAPVKLSL